MDWTVADRELSARFSVASDADDEAIRRLLRETPMRGAISVSFEREPSYFAGTGVAAGEDQTIAAFANDRLVCMGRCTRRDCWVNGQVTRVAYLAELRLAQSVRGRFGVLREGYQFFREQARNDPAEIYFTSIAADNDRARRLLERGARGMPEYRFLDELDTLLIAVPCNPPAAKLHVETATPSRVPELIRLLNSQRHHFAAVWTEQRLQALSDHGLPLDRFLVALDGSEAIGCGALWDQRAFRQTVIRDYSRSLAIARPFVNAASRVLGTPQLPIVGAVLPHAFLSPLAFVEGAETAIPEFVAAFLHLATQLDVRFITLALPTRDPRLSALRRRFSTRTWRSRLYRVDWPSHRRFAFTDSPFLPDVALL